MSNILNTNAPTRFNADGDLVGYALPDDEPISVSTKFIKSYTSRPFEDVDDLVYVVRWMDGTRAEMFTIENRWNYLLAQPSMARAA